MSLVGRAILAFSHDVTPGNELDWMEWHDREHVAERLGIPGFLRLRRYVTLGPAPRYFYFYETESEAVLQSPAYLERLSHPTPWTSRCVGHIANNKRTVCRITATLGRGLGGVLGVIELGPGPGRAEALRRWLAAEALPAAVARPGMIAAHLGEADPAATTVDVKEKQLLATPDALARWIVMVEGVGLDYLTAAVAETLGVAALREHGADGEITSGRYQLDLMMDRTG
jgi:hypothetical protein